MARPICQNPDVPSRFKAVIFDMDGVLVDSQPLFFDFELEFFREIGIPLTLAENHALVGMSLGVMYDHLREKKGLAMPRAECLDLYRRRVGAFFAAVPGLEPIPGVRRLIETLAENGVPMAVASSSPMNLIELLLNRIGLRGFFDHVLSGDQVERGKPWPDIFLAVAALLAVEPRQCVVFEDSAHGVRAGLAAGMTVVGFRNPGSGTQDISPAHFIIDSFDQIDPAGLMAGTGTMAGVDRPRAGNE